MSVQEKIGTGWGHDDGFDRAIEVLLIGLLSFMPFMFGAVQAWSEEIVVILAAALSICFCVKVLVRGSTAVVWTWAFVPVVLFLAVSVVQLMSLPVALLQLISPGTVPQKTELLNDLLGAGLEHTKATISFYPYATRHDLRLVLAVASVFVVVVSVFRRPSQIVRLLSAIAVIGASIGLLALAQDLFGNDKIYWFVASPHRTAHSGSFVNHSHYAQFMNLSIGAVLALIGVMVHNAFRHRRITPVTAAEYLGSPSGKWVCVCLATVVLGVATIFASLSRGGMISLMIAGTLTVLVFTASRRIKGTGWIMALMALGAFVCVLYIGFDAVYERLGTLSDLNDAEGGRWQLVKDVAVAWTRVPVLGAGLGTHEVVYPMFDRSTNVSVAAYAENEYAQAAEETGAIGFIALVTFGFFVWRAYVKVIRGASLPIHSAAYGLGFGLFAVLVHSLSDFGQHLPANAILTTVFCALMIRLSHLEMETEVATEKVAGVTAPACWWGSVALLAVCAVSGWAIWGADAARRGAAHWTQALAMEQQLAEKQWRGDIDEYKELLQNATVARECQKDNINYSHWLNVYRWRAISQATDPNTGEFVSSPEIQGFLDRITADLKQSLSVCPTYGPAWCVLGQLEMFFPGRDEEAIRHVVRGRKLAPCHPTVCFVAGQLHLRSGDIDAAFADFKRAVELDGNLFAEVASQLIVASGKPDSALQIAGGRVDRLMTVASILETSSERESADEAWSQVATLLEEKCREPSAPAGLFARLASVYRRSGKAVDAIACYRRALALDYSHVDWRFSLAMLLADTGDVPAAIQEAKVCLRFRPEYTAAQRLIDRLSIDPRLTE